MRPSGFSFIVGTAGHIDHGKSALVRALTGTDPDRLKEEKERGITIDLGFAHLGLPGGGTASFIDVPGHERFVRNMLAGAHGIDAVLLVVAADESVMPQTREHFHICRLLGVRRGLVAITKCDAADDDSVALTEIELKELVAGSFLEEASVVRTSAKTGEGLDELKRALVHVGKQVAPRPAQGPLRLPLDRVFSLKGFGTVVTGTLIAGGLEIGEEVEVFPSGLRGRVRGLQCHGEAVQRVEAGRRAAVNLAGLEVAELARGEVLAHPGALHASSLLDVSITLLAGERALRDQARVRVHQASAEVLARVRLMGAREVAGGETRLGQLRFERPVVAGRHDRLVLRSYSPSHTIGGALVLDPLPPKRRAQDRVGLERAAKLGPGDVGPAAMLMVAQAGRRGLDAARLAVRVNLTVGALHAVMQEAAGIVRLPGEPGAYLSQEALATLGRAAVQRVEAFHNKNPLRDSMGREELKHPLFTHTPAGTFEKVVAELEARGELRLTADSVALARHEVTLTPAEQDVRHALLDAAREAALGGLGPTALARLAGGDRRLVDRMCRLLLSEGQFARVGASLLVHREHLDDLRVQVRQRWPPGSRLDVAAIKDMTGLSRKYVIPLLEYLDRERVTRRSGADRIVLSSPSVAASRSA